MANGTKLEWGYKVDVNAPALWGARCILDGRGGGRPSLDILWDRQAIVADTAIEKDALVKALNGTEKKPGAISALRSWVGSKRAPIFFDDSTGVEIIKGVRFSWRACGGYLYVTACLDEPMAGALLPGHSHSAAMRCCAPCPVATGETTADQLRQAKLGANGECARTGEPHQFDGQGRCERCGAYR